MLSCAAHFDGSGAGVDFFPAIQVLDEAGQVAATVIGPKVAAGGSADVTFAPFLETPSTAAAGVSWAPTVGVLNGGDDVGGYITWAIDSVPTTYPALDPGDNRIVMFPAQIFGGVPAYYIVRVTGIAVDPLPFPLTVYGLKGSPGAWSGVFGGGFPGTPLTQDGGAFAWSENFDTDVNPKAIEFVYQTFYDPGAFNAFVVQYTGFIPSPSALNIALIEVFPGTTVG